MHKKTYILLLNKQQIKQTNAQTINEQYSNPALKKANRELRMHYTTLLWHTFSAKGAATMPRSDPCRQKVIEGTFEIGAPNQSVSIPFNTDWVGGT